VVPGGETKVINADFFVDNSRQVTFLICRLIQWSSHTGLYVCSQQASSSRQWATVETCTA